MVRLNNEAFQRIVDAITEAYGVCADEIIQYEIHSSKMWIVIFAILTVLTVGIMFATHLYDKSNGCSWFDEEWSCVVFVIGTILLVFFIFCFLCQINDIYYAQFFPEKIIMSHIKSAISNLSF